MIKETDFFLALDTETTGFIKKGAAVQDGQARVCQLGMILFDGKGRTIMEVLTLIKPSGWDMGEGAQKVHGITKDECELNGIDQQKAVELYRFMASKASMIVCHNSDFDRGMMEIEEAYHNSGESHKKPWFCTMKTNAHLFGGKWPKLDVALKYFCDNTLGDTAHNALADAGAAKDIFLAMNGVYA